MEPSDRKFPVTGVPEESSPPKLTTMKTMEECYEKHRDWRYATH